MVKDTHGAVISGLLALMSDEDRATCQPIVDCLLALGYVPQRQKVRGYALSFRNHQVRQSIAKIGMSGDESGRAYFALKFYACRRPPGRYLDAVRAAIEATNLQYRCCDCGACGACEGDRGYRYVDSDGREFIRCGAYVVRIPHLSPADTDGFCRLLLEQHEYFASRPH